MNSSAFVRAVTLLFVMLEIHTKLFLTKANGGEDGKQVVTSDHVHTDIRMQQRASLERCFGPESFKAIADQGKITSVGYVGPVVHDMTAPYDADDRMSSIWILVHTSGMFL